MKQRKKVVLHKTQVKTTLTVMGVLLLGMGLIITLIVLGLNHNNSLLGDIMEKNARTIHRIDNTAAIQDNIMEDLITYSQLLKDPRQKLAIQEFAMDHYKNITTIKKNISDSKNNISVIESIIKRNNILLIMIVVIIIVLGAVLYFMGLRISHRFTGPLVVISQFLNDYIKGKNPELRSLREGDELQDFYALFEKAVETVIARERDLNSQIKDKDKK